MGGAIGTNYYNYSGGCFGFGIALSHWGWFSGILEICAMRCDAMRCGAVVTCNEMECVLRTWISLPVRVLSLLMGWVRC
jgi:hypothetical protein